MEMTGLGYLGADFVLDRDRGPILLELNARPGLAIQMANQSGLGTRLERTDAAPRAVFATAESRVRWAREAFAVRRPTAAGVTARQAAPLPLQP
jgi:hypothetical protein